MSFRIERIERIIEKEVSSTLLQESKNHLLKFISITKCSLTSDGSLATIWYTILGDQSEIEATKKALLDAKGFIRSMLAKRLDTKKTPDLRFKYDESLANGKHIEDILREIKAKEQNNE